jgi:hypothetical protein
MKRPPEQLELREKLLLALIEATFPLQHGPDREVSLELLIEAAGMLKDRLEAELAELRQEGRSGE